jgi:hypothetical protein
MPLGFDRLAAWRETWGWGNADLAWEARVFGQFAVMRVGEPWSPARPVAALVGFGYSPHPVAAGTHHAPDPTAEVPWQLRFASMHGLDIHGQATTEPMVWVAIDEDGRTVVFGRTAQVGSILAQQRQGQPLRHDIVRPLRCAGRRLAADPRRRSGQRPARARHAPGADGAHPLRDLRPGARP